MLLIREVVVWERVTDVVLAVRVAEMEVVLLNRVEVVSERVSVVVID